LPKLSPVVPISESTGIMTVNSSPSDDIGGK
jgi:hypothetical protein